MSQRSAHFECFVLSPAGLSGGQLIAAASRAGAVGIIDLTYGDTTAEALLHTFQSALHFLRPSEHRVGIRATEATLPVGRQCIHAAKSATFPVTLIFSAVGEVSPSDALMAAVAEAGADEIFVETGDIATARLISEHLPVKIGLILAGSETGGAAGRTSSFLLAQQVEQLKKYAPARRILIRGAIGPRAAKACAVAKADGVVLSDEVLLFPESPSSAAMKNSLSRLDGTETIVEGGSLGYPVRFLRIPELPSADALIATATEIDSKAVDGAEKTHCWRQEVGHRLGWRNGGAVVWPIGQGIALAKHLTAQYRTVGRLIADIMSSQIAIACIADTTAATLSSDSSLAQSLGVQLPIVQGPMTRVSDRSGFAVAVAAAGAVPTIALGVMDGNASQKVLDETNTRLAGKPWAVGILGFAEPALFDAQMVAIRAVKPPIAIIAGGRSDQYKALRDLGLTPFLHAPAPRLLRLFLDQGVRHFVLEGRECGGHVGPMHSFPLWESSIAAILEIDGRAAGNSCSILFAGGLHDDISAAMVAVMSAPLVERGHHVGLLVGTAYLATDAAVASGAITAQFQKSVIDCRSTATLNSAPGHDNRCLETPYVTEFTEHRRQLIRDGIGGDALRQALDAFLMGRLRLASKGTWRRSKKLEPASAEEQLAKGMFMAGDVAAQLTATCSIDDLHGRLSRQAVARILDLHGTKPSARPPARPSDIAVIGISLALPGAADNDSYWQNILAKKNSITEIPARAWDWRLYYDSDAKTGDKTVSRWGGFFDPVEFDPLRFGIPPSSISTTSPAQLLMLQLTQDALDDAGYGNGDYDREHTSVIVAAADSAGLLGNELAIRTMLPLLSASDNSEMLSRLPEWREETFASTINSVVAGRIANRLDLGGANYTLDAACASGLTAFALAAEELVDRRANLAIVAAVDASQTPHHYIAFSNTGALSPNGNANVFDQKADGTVISEGAVVMVLKRLADAERDGDRIYGVMKGAANSSDGKALGLTAPRPAGQRRALRRAYTQAGLSPADISYYEAHGTGTPVGDKAELETISDLLREEGSASGACAIGSVKSIIGHTKTAAGLASLAKVILALHHRVLPPHAGVEQPIGRLGSESGPLYLLDKPRPWITKNEKPRRAGTSAFGFGGTNCHVILEEYPAALQPATVGGEKWPAELIILTAPDPAGIVAQATMLQTAVHGEKQKLRDIAFALARRADFSPANTFAVHFLAENAHALDITLGTLLEIGAERLADPTNLPSTIRAGRRSAVAPKTAFLFPGQGAQATFMAHEAALYLPEVFAALQAAEAQLDGNLPYALTDTIYPPAAFSNDARRQQEERLRDTRMAQPAIGAISSGLVAFLQGLGITPDMLAGHSFGEYVALTAAGAISQEALFDLAERRGRAMSKAEEGAMAALFADEHQVRTLLVDITEACIANINSPAQIVVSGTVATIDRVMARAKSTGIRAVALDVGGAFHSPLMANAQRELAPAIAAIDLKSPTVPVVSNCDGSSYPPELGDIRAQLAEHMVRPVDFVAQIKAMRSAGISLFVEIGPGRSLLNLAQQILPDDVGVTFLNVEGRALGDLLLTVADMWAAGCPVRFSQLYERRDARIISLEKLAKTPVQVNKMAWLVSGAKAVPVDAASRFASKTKPLLDQKTADEERAHRKPSTITDSAERIPVRTRLEGIDALDSSTNKPGESAVLEAYRLHQETMQHFLRTQERVLGMFLAGGESPKQPTAQTFHPQAVAKARLPLELPEIRPTAASQRAVSVPSMATANSVAQPSLDKTGITALILDLVSEITGYPADMIGLTQDIEAELGIDSIKRLEILERVQQALPAGIIARLKEDMRLISRMRTLAAWVDALSIVTEDIRPETQAAETAPIRSADEQSPIQTPTAAEIAEKTPEANPAAATGHPHPPSGTEQPLLSDQYGCPRFLMQPRAAPAANAARDHLTGLYLIASGNDLLARYVAMSLTGRGAETLIIPYADLADSNRLRDFIHTTQGERGPIRGIVHMAGTRPWQMPNALSDWQLDSALTIKSLFHMVQASLQDLLRPIAGRYGRILSVTALGGDFGRSHGPAGSPVAGASQGLLKSLSIEHPELMAKCIDIDPTIPVETMALQIVDECTLWGGRIEIGFPRAIRTVFDIEAAPLLASPSGGGDSMLDLLPNHAVILVTGGAKGITGATVAHISRPGMRIHLVGRTELPDTEPQAIAACANAAEIRAHLIATARESGKVSAPAEIEADVAKLIGARQIRRTLDELGSIGANVFYHALDIRNQDAVKALVDGIRATCGRINAVIHGAGIIEDRLFADKTPESFDRVFDTKVDGLFNICNAMDSNELKVLLLFSSIAGRFGNRGQADYGAANEALNRIALYYAQQWTSTKVVSINWGPWVGAGMAGDGVNRQFKDRGIAPISIDSGTQFVLDELQTGDAVEIIAGHGSWQAGLTDERRVFDNPSIAADGNSAS